jgi:hypothetical protein
MPTVPDEGMRVREGAAIWLEQETGMSERLIEDGVISEGKEEEEEDGGGEGEGAGAGKVRKPGRRPPEIGTVGESPPWI